MAAEKEKKFKKIGLAVTLGVHLLIFLLFFFMLAWREPDPPLPEYGIELNFGIDNTGAGQNPQPKPAAIVEEIQEEEIEETETEEAVEPEPTEIVEEVRPEETVTQPEPSPDVIEKVAEEKTEVVEKTEEVKEAPKVENPEKAKQKAASNEGDDAEQKGDKGKEEGKIDARAIYGAKGSSQGASLQMEGWNWDYIPKPEDSSNENGKIVFQITIDDQGEVIGVRTLEKTVSPEVERLYQEAIERVTFSRTADNVRPAPMSTGKITFLIKSK